MTLKSKLFLIGILIPLSLPFIWRSAFAYDVPEDSVVTVGDLFSEYVSIYKDYQIDFATPYLEEYIGLYPYCCLRAYRNSNGIYEFYFFFSDVPFFIDSDYYFLTSNSGYYQILYFSSSSQTVMRGARVHPQSGVSPNGGYWATPLITPVNSDLEFYVNFIASIYGTSYSPNLNMSLIPTPTDNRSLFCELSYLDSDTYGELPYIYVSTSDTVDYMNSYCYFEYTDARGPGQTVTVLSDQYINPHIVDEDYSAWIFSPSLISAYDCTLTSLTYYSADYGQKTIELNIDIIYGEAYPEVQDWNYFYYFTTYMESQDNDNIVYSYSTLYLSYPYNSTYYYYDFDHSVIQPFTIKVLLMPDYMVGSIWGDLMNLGSSDMSLFYQIYEQFDLILTNVNQSTFDAFYGQQGIYDSIHTDWNRDQKEGLRDLFALVPTYINANENVFSNLSASMYQTDVGFIYTRSFLMKRIITNLGDIDDRLLEFETRLVDEDGVLYGIQTKLNNLYFQDNEFYNDMARFVRRWDYWLDENVLGSISSKLDSILTRLNDILNSIGNVDVPVDLEDLGAYRPLKAIYDFVYSLYGWTSDHIGFMLASFNGLRTGYIGEVSGTPIPLLPYPSDVPAIPTINVTPIPIPVIPTYVPIESGG